jgi:hypothetical protein
MTQKALLRTDCCQVSPLAAEAGAATSADEATKGVKMAVKASIVEGWRFRKESERGMR